jgi:DNA-binding transcriptional ArsR family regulator
VDVDCPFIAGILKTISETNRVAVLVGLIDGPKTVIELAEKIDVDDQHVRAHLLRFAGRQITVASDEFPTHFSLTDEGRALIVGVLELFGVDTGHIGDILVDT